MTNRQLIRWINQECMPNGLYLAGKESNRRVSAARVKAGVLQFWAGVWIDAPADWSLASGSTGQTVLTAGG